MKAMQSTMVYLTPEQKQGLARRAQQRKTKVAAEIRSAQPGSVRRISNDRWTG